MAPGMLVYRAALFPLGPELGWAAPDNLVEHIKAGEMWISPVLAAAH